MSLLKKRALCRWVCIPPGGWCQHADNRADANTRKVTSASSRFIRASFTRWDRPGVSWDAWARGGGTSKR